MYHPLIVVAINLKLEDLCVIDLGKLVSANVVYVEPPFITVKDFVSDRAT